MAVGQLKVENVRNLEASCLCLHAGVNLITGANGSGKTSLLEALHMLGLGRSFRTGLLKRVIAEGTQQLSVFAELEDEQNTNLGLIRELNGSLKLRLDGQNVKSIAALAGVLPIQLLHAESFRLLHSPPKVRRQFLDWAVFHVEPSFFPLWKQYHQLLKQRNALLRQCGSYEQLRAWDVSLIGVAEKLDKLREAVFSAWYPIITEVVAKLFPEKAVDIAYTPGWDRNKGLKEVLEGAYFRDNLVQYTQYGPHRADLSIKVAGTPAQHRLSIGQQKMLISSLYIAQGLLLKGQTGKSCLYLIDDLPAELDKGNLARVAGMLLDMEAQILVTSVDLDSLSPLLEPGNTRVFHVEHGAVTQTA